MDQRPVRVFVIDDHTVSREHFGLRSMPGRVADLGGQLQVTSALGRGTVLRVEVPAQRCWLSPTGGSQVQIPRA
jgi:signal transduction histidine kinase